MAEEKKISKRKMESYKRAEKVCQELRYQMAIYSRQDYQSVFKYLMRWMNTTGEKVKFKRPKGAK